MTGQLSHFLSNSQRKSSTKIIVLCHFYPLGTKSEIGWNILLKQTHFVFHVENMEGATLRSQLRVLATGNMLQTWQKGVTDMPIVKNIKHAWLFGERETVAMFNRQ